MGRTMLRLLGVRGAVHATLMVGHLCPGWSERVFGASARPDGPAGPALPGSARLGVLRPFRRGTWLVMAGGAPEAVRPARGPRRRFKGEGDRRRHPRRRSKAESMTRPGLQAVAVLGVATVRGGPWWTSVGYSRAAGDARNRHLLAPNAFVVPASRSLWWLERPVPRGLATPFLSPDSAAQPQRSTSIRRWHSAVHSSPTIGGQPHGSAETNRTFGLDARRMTRPVRASASVTFCVAQSHAIDRDTLRLARCLRFGALRR